MGIYFSPVWHSLLPEYRNKFGYIASPKAGGTAGVWRAVEEGFRWILDNGVYSGVFNEEKWLAAMDRFTTYQENCVAVVVPDVLHRKEDGSVVGDWHATVEQFNNYVPLVVAQGYRPAFVTRTVFLSAQYRGISSTCCSSAAVTIINWSKVTASSLRRNCAVSGCMSDA